jgi:hypothetical protein
MMTTRVCVLGVLGVLVGATEATDAVVTGVGDPDLISLIA